MGEGYARAVRWLSRLRRVVGITHAQRVGRTHAQFVEGGTHAQKFNGRVGRHACAEGSWVQHLQPSARTSTSVLRS